MRPRCGPHRGPTVVWPLPLGSVPLPRILITSVENLMRIARSLHAVAALLLLALTAACSALESGDVAIQPRIGQRDGRAVTNPAIPRDPRLDSGSVGTSVPTLATTVRRVCRTTGWPRDWAATAYETATGECPLSVQGDSSAVAAIIVRLSAQPVGSLLDICADQAVPRGWQAVSIEDEVVSQRCPGAGSGGASAMRRIRRMR